MRCRICGGYFNDPRRKECELCAPSGTSHERKYRATINEREAMLIDEQPPDALTPSLIERWFNLAGRL